MHTFANAFNGKHYTISLKMSTVVDFAKRKGNWFGSSVG